MRHRRPTSRPVARALRLPTRRHPVEWSRPAGWAYRLGLEVILGVRPSRGAWRLDPHVPAHWPELEVILRDGGTTVRIVVENPRGVNSGVERMLLDGKPIEPPILPRLEDGRTHEVRVTMG